nr:uncharacterized protein LOC110567221 [Aotus nancymaae]
MPGPVLAKLPAWIRGFVEVTATVGSAIAAVWKFNPPFSFPESLHHPRITFSPTSPCPVPLGEVGLFLTGSCTTAWRCALPLPCLLEIVCRGPGLQGSYYKGEIQDSVPERCQDPGTGISAHRWKQVNLKKRWVSATLEVFPEQLPSVESNVFHPTWPRARLLTGPLQEAVGVAASTVAFLS